MHLEPNLQAHQYLQAINQMQAVKSDPHVWTHDGDMAETYGLEPNYGCCTANFNQGCVLTLVHTSQPFCVTQLLLLLFSRSVYLS